MIDVPSSLEEVLALPSIGLLDRDLLPSEPGLYFAVLNGDRVAYIGRSNVSLRSRWVYHHRSIDLLVSGNPILYFMTTIPPLSLKEAEGEAIRRFLPEFNKVRPLPPLSSYQPTDTSHSELLTIPQAAAELDLTRATLWKHIKSGRLTGAQQLGGQNGLWVIDREVLDAFKAEHPPRERKPGPKPGRPRAAAP